MAHTRSPAIPIRVNRSVKLRFESNKYNPTTLSVPSKSEMSRFVAGQNKAEELVLDKKLQSWYREKSFIVDKMNRYQNATYDTFVRIEGERKDLTQVPDVLDLYQEETASNGAQGEVAGKGGGGTTLDGAAKGSGEPMKVSTTKVDVTPLTKVAVDAEDVMISKKGNVVPLPSINAHKELRPFTEGSRLRRPSNASEASAFRPRTTAVVPQTAPVGDDPSPTPARASAHPESAHVLERLRKAKLTRLRKSRPSAADVASYKMDNTGKILFSDIPYRRRKFPSPRGQNMEMFESRLHREESAQDRNKERFLNLSRSITFLDDSKQWSPLGLVRTIRAQDDKASRDSERPKAGLGVLDYMVRAFSSRRQERLLEGLDPNSEEALRLCQYIRLKEPEEQQQQQQQQQLLGK